MTTQPGLVAVRGFSLIRASGADAMHFLHGQFTQKIEGLGGSCRSAGYCSPKGRLLAAMRAWLAEDGSVMLMMPEVIAESFLKRIRMYVLRAKVTFTALEPAPLMAAFIGEAGSKAAQALGLALPAAGEARRDAEKGLLLLGLQPAAAVEGFCAGGQRTLAIALPGTQAPLAAPADDGALFRASEEAAGVAQVYPETRELFVPQAANFELAGGVVFDKGCYPGQEVISRVQHIGETNRRAALGIAEGAAQVRPGDPVYAAGDEAGRVIDAVSIGGRTLVFFSATLAAIAEGASLAADGPKLAAAALPYAWKNAQNA